MLYYARSDTHFLLYIYDKLRNELIERSDGTSNESNRLEGVLENSKETSLQRYQRFIYNQETGSGSGGWYSILARTPGMFDKDQFAVFRALHQWRDNVAREVDESVHRVMPKQAVIQVSKIMPLDQRSMQALIRSTSHGALSQATSDRISDLVKLVRKAKKESANDPEVGTYLASIRPGARIHAAVETTVVPTKQEQNTLMDVTPITFDVSLQPRTVRSQFWGPTFGSSLWSSNDRPIMDESLRLALPMPPLTAEIFESPSEQTSAKTSTRTGDPGARAEHAYVKDRKAKKDEDDNVFVIKQMGGRKGKAKDSKTNEIIDTHKGIEFDLDGPAVRTDAQPHSDPKEERRAARKKRNAERKGNKKQDERVEDTISGLDGLNTNGDDGQTEDPLDEEPFDYANATSVLHAKTQNSDGRKVKKEFNPYSKSTDAPKGMRRVKKEQPGKSATFKN
jgi:exosome complex exonuclease RRP6